MSGNAFCIFGVGRYTCIFGCTDVAGFGRGAAAIAGLGFCASEEEDLVEVTKKGRDAVAATMTGFGEASASPMGASTEAEVDAAMKAGLVGAALSPMMTSMAEEDAAAMAGLGDSGEPDGGVVGCRGCRGNGGLRRCSHEPEGGVNGQGGCCGDGRLWRCGHEPKGGIDSRGGCCSDGGFGDVADR
jgi:hypothetical protein